MRDYEWINTSSRMIAIRLWSRQSLFAWWDNLLFLAKSFWKKQFFKKIIDALNLQWILWDWWRWSWRILWWSRWRRSRSVTFYYWFHRNHKISQMLWFKVNCFGIMQIRKALELWTDCQEVHHMNRPVKLRRNTNTLYPDQHMRFV